MSQVIGITGASCLVPRSISKRQGEAPFVMLILDEKLRVNDGHKAWRFTCIAASGKLYRRMKLIRHNTWSFFYW